MHVGSYRAAQHRLINPIEKGAACEAARKLRDFVLKGRDFQPRRSRLGENVGFSP